MRKQKEIKEFKDVRAWAEAKGLIFGGDTKTQFIKLVEEVGELGETILKNQPDNFKQELGDVIVVLINLGAIAGINSEDALRDAYAKIMNRTGKMSNGTFTKDEK